LTVLAALALIAAGCGSSENADSDTAAGTGTAAATTAAKNATSKAMKFAQCMRDNGVKEFPDPDGSGELTIDGVLNGSSLDADGPAWKQAMSACKDLEPSGFTGGRRTHEQQSASLKFADCIRKNGVKDFPDPINGQPLVDTNRIPSANREGGMTILNAAMDKCGDAAREAIGSRR
jgi:hypothetical protein